VKEPADHRAEQRLKPGETEGKRQNQEGLKLNPEKQSQEPIKRKPQIEQKRRPNFERRSQHCTLFFITRTERALDWRKEDHEQKQREEVFPDSKQ
jgi:hypothetical protein